MLDPFETYLRKRWQEGCRNASQLWREIKVQGYPGTPKRVLEWARQHREEPVPSTPGRYRTPWPGAARDARYRSRSVRRIALPRPSAWCGCFWTIRRIWEASSTGQAERFGNWLGEALASGVKDFETFAMGLKREQSGVEAALTLPYSNRQKEGQINKLKLIKRQMYGRGSFEMLRQRVLGAA